ncbi:MAG: M3 family peptidase [Puniceicoccaceae bacterium]|nr:MAG: M3 family peptidase [Puniceicoccaceae bacterium]
MPPHPFLEDDFFIRWTTLVPERVEPDISAALAEAQGRIDALASLDPSGATFANTFAVLEEATERLSRAWGKVGHLTSVADSKPLREAYNAMLPKVSEFYTRIPLDDRLWKVLKAARDRTDRNVLTPVHLRFLDETVADFIQHGADLPAEKKARFAAIQLELASITQKFSENVLDATNAWELVIEDESRLAGLPDSAKEAARDRARRKGCGSDEKPAWRFTLQMPSMEPVMSYAEDEALRKEVWEAASSLGRKEPFDNAPLIRSILKLRAEQAALLGRESFADLVLERRMAKNGADALEFVEDLQQRIAAPFAEEAAALEEFRARHTGEERRRLEPWEIAYWAEKLRREQYSFDQEEVRPYFPLGRVMEGMFALTERLFGVRVRARNGAETWHEEVSVYDLEDVSGEYLGSFYADWFPRESKRDGAWMNSLLTGLPPRDGRPREPHLGLICGNLTPPVGDRPSLLTHREVETIFHEFGHLLHHLLSEVEIRSLAGTNVSWDFVELPSQIMENWCWEREGLDLFARHYQTGEPIPEELFQKMVATKNFRSASFFMRQLSFAKMDMELHHNTTAFLEGDPEQKLRPLLEPYTIPTRTPAPTIACRFSHLFSSPTGYAAGYYSYKWAEVLDADAFTRFREEGLFSPAVGAEFRRHILSRGNSAPPEELYRAFRGRDPELDPLLERCGLLAPT